MKMVMVQIIGIIASTYVKVENIHNENNRLKLFVQSQVKVNLQ